MLYDDSPDVARVPLTAEQVESLLLTDGAAFAREPRLVRHLLTRMRATFDAHSETRRRFERGMEDLKARQQKERDPIVGAVKALSRCTLDEQRELYNQQAQSLLDEVQRANAQIANARLAAASETNRARLVLAQVAQTPGLPAEALNVLQQALAQLPVVRHQAPSPVVLPEDGGFTVEPSLEDLLFPDHEPENG